MPSLLSVDIWDTLIRRRCHPDEVKLATARTLWTSQKREIRPRIATLWALLEQRVRAEAEIAREKHLAGLDNEYAIEEVLGRWLERVLRPRVSVAHRLALAEMLTLAEVEQEIFVTYADPHMLRALRHHEADRIVGLSDFYLGEKHLTRIVDAACDGHPLSRIYVSCDCYLNKIKGRLFALAQRETLTPPEEHTHIGDNKWSDVDSPRRFGIRAVHFQNPDEERGRAAHRARFEVRRGGNFVPTAQLLTRALREACSPPDGLEPRQRQLYEIGHGAAPVYAALVMGAMEEALSRGCPAIHYFTREGVFFKQVHEAMAPRRPLGLPSPRAELLEVSRLCTFLPSLREVSTREMMRVWNLYSRQSIATFLRTLDVNPLPFEPLLKRHGIDPEPVIEFPWKDRRVQRLFADPLFVRLVEQQRDRRRAVVLEYLRSKGLGGHDAVIVDVGWRGTIQDNLAHLLPGRHIAGWYLGLFGMLNEQPTNASKHTIGPDGRRDPETLVQIIQNVAPLEMLANTDTGSVRRYGRGADGAIVAERVHDEGEDRVWREHTRYFQQGALAAAPVVADWARTFAVEPREMRTLVLDLLRSIKGAPPRAVAEAYFELSHNETFGVGGFVRKRAELPASLIRKGEESRGSDPEFVKAIEATDWPQGLLKILGHEELCRQYNTFREERARRIDRRNTDRAERKTKAAGPRQAPPEVTTRPAPDPARETVGATGP